MQPSAKLPFLRHVQPQNFLSFGPEFPGIELRSLNVLIGPNGSGKSNLIEAINFMRAAPKDWQAIIRKGGGVAEWIWKPGRDGEAKVTVALNSPQTSALENQTPIVHVASFRAANQRFTVSYEGIYEGFTKLPDVNTGDLWFYSTDLDGIGPYLLNKVSIISDQRIPVAPPATADRSILAEVRDSSHYPELFWMSESYNSARIYREWSFGRNSVLREPQKADLRSDWLEEDFSNLGLFLNRLKSRFPAAKRAILDGLKDLYDGIEDYDVAIEGGTVQVFFTEGEHVIPATRLSDGTLRYLCLLAILCNPQPPSLVCIEEPEIGLHPDLLPKLAELLIAASQRTQIVVTTHSDILVDAMSETPESVVVCSKENGQTQMARLDPEELKVWLETYRLGQLWTKGQIGGARW